MSGLLLFVSDFPLHFWPLQFIACIPFLIVLEKWTPTTKRAALAGCSFGLAYALPLFIVLEFPWSMGIPLALYLTLMWTLFALGAKCILKFSSILGPILLSALAVVIDYVGYTALPVWGTAQSFVRVLSCAPWLVQIASITGVAGLVFGLILFQSLIVRAVLQPAVRRTCLLTLFGWMGLWSFANLWGWHQPAHLPKMKVAAMGWTQEHLTKLNLTAAPSIFRSLYVPFFMQAAKEGAKLIVSPEVGFFLTPEEKQTLWPKLSQLARRNRIMLAVGYFDRHRNDNRLAIFDEQGVTQPEYIKTHLIPFIETYSGGSGHLPIWSLGGWRIGGLICQDDNFTDLSRAYGRQRISILALPTNDWVQVKDFHLENTLFRAVENRFGLVRAASNGHSAIVNFRGEILAKRDHFHDGAGIISADLPLTAGGGLYSIAGDWWVVVCGLLLCGAWIGSRRSRSVRRRTP